MGKICTLTTTVWIDWELSTPLELFRVLNSSFFPRIGAVNFLAKLVFRTSQEIKVVQHCWHLGLHDNIFRKDLFSAARYWTRERCIQRKMESPTAKLQCQLSQDGKKNIYVVVRSRRVIGGHHKAIPQLGILNSMVGANSRHSLEQSLHSALCSLPPVFTWTTISRINKKFFPIKLFDLVSLKTSPFKTSTKFCCQCPLQWLLNRELGREGLVRS